MTMQIWISSAQAFTALLSVFVAGFVAVVGAKISNQQAQTARQKLRLDLFPLRLKVYNAAFDAIVSALNLATEEVFNDITMELSLRLREARFLFTADVFDYLNEVETRVLLVRVGKLQLSNDVNGLLDKGYRDSHNKNTFLLLSDLSEINVRLKSALKIDETASFSLLSKPLTPNMDSNSQPKKGS